MILAFDDFSTKFKGRINAVAHFRAYFHPYAPIANITINEFNTRGNFYRVNVIYASNYEIRCMKTLQS